MLPTRRPLDKKCQVPTPPKMLDPELGLEDLTYANQRKVSEVSFATGKAVQGSVNEDIGFGDSEEGFPAFSEASTISQRSIPSINHSSSKEEPKLGRKFRPVVRINKNSINLIPRLDSDGRGSIQSFSPVVAGNMGDFIPDMESMSIPNSGKPSYYRNEIGKTLPEMIQEEKMKRRRRVLLIIALLFALAGAGCVYFFVFSLEDEEFFNSYEDVNESVF
eukprot:augustus_masked-scaffold_33-processed-gene-0.12-mRNA-1 protein AED:1.00 eAED:1.00 QI:0/-1/0/0/-1/1/1/0/218